MLRGRATAVRDKHQIKPQINQSVLGRDLCVCTLQFNVGSAHTGRVVSCGDRITHTELDLLCFIKQPI